MRMVALQIRNVPEDVRGALTLRAEQAGQSLQCYLLSIITREADYARNVELIEELAT